jgi:hypothetical protein
MMTRVCALLLVSACTSDTGMAPPATTEAGVPCNVEAVLRARCQKCHAEIPQFAAPMSLVSHDDFFVPARSNPEVRVIDVLPGRIAVGSGAPMPPVTDPPLSEAERAVLEQWIAGGTPSSTEECMQEPMMPEMPDELPCGEPDYAFLAHELPGPTDTTPHVVEPDAGNSIRCFAFRVPEDEQLYLQAAAPVIDDARVLHHWILWGSNADIEDGSIFDCNGNMPADAQFLTGWAPGGNLNVFPEGVGLALPPPGGTLILQVHYWNGMELPDVTDRSGVGICASTETPEHVAAVHTLGSILINVPPHGTQSTTGYCAPTTTEPIHVLSSGPHMHQIGTAIRTEILRGGDESDMEMLVEVDPWNFNDQGGHPTDIVLMPGDVLRTTCEYANPGSSTVRFGERTEDEMCFNFVVAYPAGSLVAGLGASRNACIELTAPLR